VYVHPGVEPAGLSLLTQAAVERFGLQTRYVGRSAASPYLLELYDQHAEGYDWPAHLRTPAVLDAQETLAAAELDDGSNVSGSLGARLSVLDMVVKRLSEAETDEAIRAAGQQQLPVDD
jgi:hypothetical protein